MGSLDKIVGGGGRGWRRDRAYLLKFLYLSQSLVILLKEFQLAPWNSVYQTQKLWAKSSLMCLHFKFQEGKALPENSFILFVYFWLGWVFVAAWAFSGCRLLIVVAFLAVDHGL